MRLEQDPRVTPGANFFTSVIEWMRRATPIINSTADIADKLANGPAFGAWRSGGQTWPNNTYAQIVLNTEEYDTASCFNTANGRFTPNVPGYYQISGVLTEVCFGGTLTNAQVHLWKNGAIYKRGGVSLVAQPLVSLSVAALIPLNGTTDYVTLAGFGIVSAGVPEASGGSATETWMTGYLARPL
ncbi:hypothetical protein J7E62_09210 [Variovorax paradoxus]|nr:hypothetical protein [Variovorax paradoxus]